MSTQKRWVLLEIDVDVPEKEIAEVLEEDITQYITNELNWCKDSFSDLNVLWIADSYEPDAQVEE